MDSESTKEWNEAITEYNKWQVEMDKHNQELLKSIKHKKKDFNNLLDFCEITDKMEWVNKPNFKQENKPDKFGVFKLEYVDQWAMGMEGDSFAGFMYVRVDGHEKYLKIPYSC